MNGFGVVFTINDPNPACRVKAWFYEYNDATTYAGAYQNYGAQIEAMAWPTGPRYREQGHS
jgi:hypothetical protein